MDRIKRLSMEILEEHKSQFGVDFGDNKKTLDKISIIRSKGLKNEIAGYITKLLKHEIRDQQLREERAKQSAELESQSEEIEATEDSDSASETIEANTEEPETSETKE